jgi:hypothetical protein
VKDIGELEDLLAARMPIVAIESREESKLLQMFERFAVLNERSLWTWSVTSGLKQANGKNSAFNTARIEDALRHIEKSPGNAICLFLDAHRFLDDPVVLRQIKEKVAALRDWARERTVPAD